MNIYSRIQDKNKNCIYDLSQDERETLENMMIENFTVRITALSDEKLMNEATDTGVI